MSGEEVVRIGRSDKSCVEKDEVRREREFVKMQGRGFLDKLKMREDVSGDKIRFSGEKKEDTNRKTTVEVFVK